MKRLAALLVMMLSACRDQETVKSAAPMLVHCVAPQKGPFEETLTLRGRLLPPPGGDLSVASQVAGRVVLVTAREGQRVERGDAVATVDGAASQDAVHQAEASLAQARAAAANAQGTLGRVRALVARGIAAQQELDDVTARAEVESQGVAASTAALDLAKRTLGRVQVRSGAAGLVTRIFRGVGALVDGTASTPILQLASTSQTELVVAATAWEVASIEPGQRAHIELEGTPATLDGEIIARASALDPKTGLGAVRVSVETESRAVLGAYGRAQVVIAHHDDVPLLPASALRGAVSDGAEVVVCKGTTAEVRTVKIGYRDASHFSVTSGLNEGERVMVDHALGIETGAPIAEAP